MSPFVGRIDALTRLHDAYQAVRTGLGAGGPHRAGLVLVTGEAGIGKTAMLARFAAAIAEDGGWPVWGTCWDGDKTPAFWPWTQALRAIIDLRPELGETTSTELAAVLPELATPGSTMAGRDSSDAYGRLRVFDAVARLLRRAAATSPVVVILDDLQWSDQSTIELVRFLANQAGSGPLLLVGAYRPGEAEGEVAAALSGLTSADVVVLRGLSAEETTKLVAAVAEGHAADWGEAVHDRSGGHPFFARELCQLLASGASVQAVPAAIRGVIDRRLVRLSSACRELLTVAAAASASKSATSVA
ncbi:MAG TPA: AAA family ATPase, partial [Gaiellales bacterium]|nr:AAA family ATPase [Gaiellales bacterium]